MSPPQGPNSLKMPRFLIWKSYHKTIYMAALLAFKRHSNGRIKFITIILINKLSCWINCKPLIPFYSFTLNPCLGENLERRLCTYFKNPHPHYIESPSHLMWCKAYEDLRQGKDPELVVADRAPYLLKVVVRRKELEEQLRSRSKQN